MTAETIARMTPSEFKEMLETVVEATVERTLLEMLGDPRRGPGDSEVMYESDFCARDRTSRLDSMVNHSMMSSDRLGLE